MKSDGAKSAAIVESCEHGVSTPPDAYPAGCVECAYAKGVSEVINQVNDREWLALNGFDWQTWELAGALRRRFLEL